VGNLFTYTGREFDSDSRLMHYRARAYDPAEGRFKQRDPLEYVDSFGLYTYVASNPINGLDPLGLEDDIPWEKYLEDFLKNHPDLSKKQRKWVEKQLARGCVGVTCANVGAREDLSNCFDTKEHAEARQKEMAQTPDCCPQLFSVHLWNDTGKNGTDPDLKIDPATSKADLSNWNQSGRPPGAWKPSGDSGYYFDYGHVGTDGSVTHADHYHNPDKNGDGKGDYYRRDKITESTIKKGTLQEWKNSYPDFNAEVWCVQCKGTYH
jgi:RHS repeat-associated protein